MIRDTATQPQMFNDALRRSTEKDKLFLEFVADGMTREELAQNIERRPEVWGRYKIWLDRLPSKGQSDSP